ncbi:hypothetical protein Taro_011867, partial [Colocasia esculenta]|nr:hypothetical protein [Colocasia esculenta]
FIYTYKIIFLKIYNLISFTIIVQQKKEKGRKLPHGDGTGGAFFPFHLFSLSPLPHPPLNPWEAGTANLLPLASSSGLIPCKTLGGQLENIPALVTPPPPPYSSHPPRMSGALDVSLDDRIENNKKAGGGSFRGSRRESGPGPARRFPNRAGNRPAPYNVGKLVQAPNSAWQHDMFLDQIAVYPGPALARPSAIETGTKLYISNLDYGVSDDDIKELFSEVGELKRSSVNYDRSGRSKGTAEVVFSRRADAIAAVKRYNNVQLDGKPMKIEIVGTNIVTQTAPLPQITNGILGNPNGLQSGPVRGSSTGWSRGGGRGRGRGRRQGKGRNDQISAADLDADLDKYHSKAMQTN